MMAQALHMGDEVHKRNAAATGLLIKRLIPALLLTGLPIERIQRVTRFIVGNDRFFLNLSMAACKAMTDAAHNVPFSSMITVMARNGVNFGIRMSGTGDRWFQAPANPVEGLFFPGYGVEDAAADLGDSAITETAGVGGFAMASSPAIVKFVGGTPADATSNSRRMQAITLGGNPAFTLPALNFAPTAAGIDARKVVDRGILPIIPPKANRREPPACDFRRYRDRNHVERLFNRLKQSRRIATRYDKTAASFLGFLSLAAAKLWLADYVNRT